MKTKMFFIILFAVIFNSCEKKEWQQKTGVLWYLPTMTENQAINLFQYDVIVIDPENFINNPKSVDVLKINNPKIKILLYVNQTEIFEPMWQDKPWSIQLLKELNERPEWWLRQPDGSKLGAWGTMYGLDMRADCPTVKGEKYWQFIAKKYITFIKKYKQIDGVLYDNSWGDNTTGITWLATYKGQKGFDFNKDGIADKNFDEINKSWTQGMKNLMNAVRQAMGNNFIEIANPGNLSYLELDGKQFETFPYPYHDLKGGNDWEINMKIAAKFKVAFINPEEENYFLGLCSSVMQDNLIFFNAQNTPFSDNYDLKLGKPLSKMKKLKNNTYARKFQQGDVFIRNGKTAWIKYRNGKTRKE